MLAGPIGKMSTRSQWRRPRRIRMKPVLQLGRLVESVCSHRSEKKDKKVFLDVV